MMMPVSLKNRGVGEPVLVAVGVSCDCGHGEFSALDAKSIAEVVKLLRKTDPSHKGHMATFSAVPMPAILRGGVTEVKRVRL